MNTQRLTKEIFTAKAISIHGQYYDYSKVVYVNNRTHVDIICPQHGVFTKTPLLHLLGQGCKVCSGKLHTTETFIEKARSIHGEKFDYSLVNYVKGRAKIKIICRIHGEFEQVAEQHIHDKNGCPTCAGRINDDEQFIKKAKQIHGETYSYKLVEYINNRTKIKIICNKHGIFEQIPDSHINKGSGCPDCKKSIGENLIKKFLTEKGIKFISQKTFKNCKNPNTGRLLPFDFYIPAWNVCIEYDGLQHFKSVALYGGEEYFTETRFKDELRNAYCKQNCIELIRIKYETSLSKLTEKIKLILDSRYNARMT